MTDDDALDLARQARAAGSQRANPPAPPAPTDDYTVTLRFTTQLPAVVLAWARVQWDDPDLTPEDCVGQLLDNAIDNAFDNAREDGFDPVPDA